MSQNDSMTLYWYFYWPKGLIVDGVDLNTIYTLI